jgi:hypothetical protein
MPDLPTLGELGTKLRTPGVPDRVREPLKMVLSLRGTPVAMNPRLFVTPMPAKVLPWNRLTGSILNTRFAPTSLK